jgi:hypothetical protein
MTCRLLAVAIVVVSPVAAAGQDQPPPRGSFTIITPRIVEPAGDQEAVVERARAMVQSRITTGAPYSAETVSESVQVLADGNRIVRRTVTRVYRDTEGRVRTEHVNDQGDVERVNISDPVAGHSYVLYPDRRTAYRTGGVMVTRTLGGVVAFGRGGARSGGGGAGAGGAGGRGRGGTVSGGVGRGAGGGVSGGAVAGGRVSARGGSGVSGGGGRSAVVVSPVTPRSEVTREDLGSQVVEGVLATGTRTTTVIPAGTIGNDQPIRVVSEQWFASDLQVLVLTKHSDPRVGETTFRLTNVIRADQARSLFEVPADYRLETGRGGRGGRGPGATAPR